ncbi:MAG: transglutaminase domain-containing protein [Chitinophagaceae bacterium]|nr:MAG: transglutaminase domain-containing protein [Chitinophagaceae bacterium]
MKYCFLLLALASAVLPCSAQKAPGKLRHQGLPVLVSETDTLRFSVGTYQSTWTVSKKVAHDSLAFASMTPVAVTFYAGADSIRFHSTPASTQEFYVLRDGHYAHTVVYNRAYFSTLHHRKAKAADSLHTYFDASPADVAYFRELRARYPIDSLVAGAPDDATRVLRILHWVHGQWKHNGGQAPQKGDALSILEEARTGKGFPCFAYAEVLRAALGAAGIPCRKLALKKKTVETDPNASGHVANEVYLRDLGTWVFADPQEDVMPWLGKTPLNAIGFQRAITSNARNLTLKSYSVVSKEDYIDFAYPYLYYIDAAFDHRYGGAPKISVSGMSNLMLVPKGAPHPRKAGFYNNQKIDYCIYTDNLNDFYAPPARL